jgi:ATP-dependent DNA ligase
LIGPPGFKKIATDAWRINARSAIIDGEVVAPAEDGVSDFSVLQKEIRGEAVGQACDLCVRSALPEWQ